jgi:hypothetical protein
MPVMLPEEYHAGWLNPDAAVPEWLQTVLRPYSAAATQATPLNPRINNARHQGQEGVEPVEWPRPSRRLVRPRASRSLDPLHDLRQDDGSGFHPC